MSSMMASMATENTEFNTLYWSFYLEGRQAKLLKGDIDAEELAQSLLDDRTQSMRDVITAACTKAVVTLDGSKARRKWFAAHDDVAPLTQEEAYKAYCRGRAEELAYSLEVEVVEYLDALTGEDDGDGDGEEDEEDESEDEEDE